MKHLLLWFLLCPLLAAAQLAETFADGDFTKNPAWTGDAGSFRVANQVLQSNGPAVTGTQAATRDALPGQLLAPVGSFGLI